MEISHQQYLGEYNKLQEKPNPLFQYFICIGADFSQPLIPYQNSRHSCNPQILQII